LLARRDFCSAELAARLGASGFEPAAVQGAVEQLIEQRYLNDERYARLFVALHADRGHGPLRIAQDLRDRGLPTALIEMQLETHGHWADLARATRARRFGPEPPTSWVEQARQARFLQYRGFSNDHIRAALGPEASID
jgi:regulatory protein